MSNSNSIQFSKKSGVSSDTATILDRIASTFNDHLIIRPEQASALALWTAHTWFYENFQHTPRLAVVSPEKGCGKSTLLDVLAKLCRDPMKVDAITSAALPRLVESRKGVTLLIDEADTFVPGNEALRGILNSGFAASGKAIRNEKTKDGKWTPTEYPTFCAVALASIGGLPDTVADRSVSVKLRRKTQEERVLKLRTRTKEIAGLREDIEPWAQSVDLAAVAEPSIPDDFTDRQGDICVPLLTIADLAGGDWPGRARNALSTLFAEARDHDDSASHGVMLLSDIRLVFDQKGEDRLTSADLCSELWTMEERPWPRADGGRPLSPNKLAHMLKPFGIKPRNMRQGKDVHRGYERCQFEDTWARYVPARHPQPESADAVTV